MTTKSDLDRTLADLPKHKPPLDVGATLKELDEILDVDKEKSRLQKQLREERGRTTRLSKELDDARDKLAGQSALIGMLQLDDAPPPPDRSLEKRATDAEGKARVAEGKIRGAEARAEIAKGRADAAEFAIQYERQRVAQAERERDEANARAATTDEDVTRRVAVQIAKVKGEIHSGGFKDGWLAALDNPEITEKRADRAAKKAVREASNKAYQERYEAILARLPRPRTPEKELKAAIEAAS